MNLTVPTAIVCLMAGLSPLAAETEWGDMFKMRGFLTLEATHCSLKNADYISNATLPNGPGHSRSIDWVNESRLGLQADAHFTPWLSGALQVLVGRNYDATFTPSLNMAFLKVQALPWLSFRVGRMPSSTYLISDYRKVGYSMPWAYPPVEIYQNNPFNTFDGAEMAVKHKLGPVALTWQLQAKQGKAKYGTVPVGTLTAKDMYSLSLTGNYGYSTFKMQYLQMKFTLENSRLDALFTAMRTPGSPYYAPALADAYQMRGKSVEYENLSYSYDPGPWFISSEIMHFHGKEGMFIFNTCGYLTGGARLGDWTPYATLAKQRSDTSPTHPHPIIRGILSTRDKAQTSQSVGVRWDFRKNMDVKFQFDHVKHADTSYGATILPQPDFRPGGSYNLATLCFDMVF